MQRAERAAALVVNTTRGSEHSVSPGTSSGTSRSTKNHRSERAGRGKRHADMGMWCTLSRMDSDTTRLCSYRREEHTRNCGNEKSCDRILRRLERAILNCRVVTLTDLLLLSGSKTAAHGRIGRRRIGHAAKCLKIAEVDTLCRGNRFASFTASIHEH